MKCPRSNRCPRACFSLGRIRGGPIDGRAMPGDDRGVDVTTPTPTCSRGESPRQTFSDNLAEGSRRPHRAVDRSTVSASPFRCRRSHHGRADGDRHPGNACAWSGVDRGERGLWNVSRDNRGRITWFVARTPVRLRGATQSNPADRSEPRLGDRAPIKEHRRRNNRAGENRSSPWRRPDRLPRRMPNIAG